MKIHFNYNPKTLVASFRCDDEAIQKLIRHHFSVPNKTAGFQSKWAAKRNYAFTPSGRFELGMFYDIVRHIKDVYTLENVTYSNSFLNVLDVGIKHHDLKEIKSDKFKLYYYQKKIVERAMHTGRGVCVLGTGGGKTLTIATLISNFIDASASGKDFKCLIIVPDLGLVTQTAGDFEDYGVPFTYCKWTGGVKGFDYDPLANVVIANAGVIQRRFHDEEWIKYVDLLVVDETHKIKKGKATSKIVQKILTPNKFGFTGTLPDEENQVDTWSIIGKIGPVFYEKGSAELRDEGFLTNVETSVLSIDYIHEPFVDFEALEVDWSTTRDYVAELDFIYGHPYRNKVIKSLCENFDDNILLLVNHIRHGEKMQEILEGLTGRTIYFVQGSVEVDKREEIKAIMEKETGVICIAMAAIFSTGINIKNIHMIILASPGKAFIRLVQSIGRGLRKHKTKKKLILIDIADKLKYGLEHLEKRLEIYQREKIAFKITSLKENS